MSKFDEAVRSKTKIGEVLKFKDQGLSVEDARKAMLAAGEAPKGMAGGNVPVHAAEVPTPPAVAVAAAVPAVTPDLETLFEDEISVTPVTPKETPVSPAPAIAAS